MAEATALIRLKVTGEEEIKRIYGEMGLNSKKANALIVADAKQTGLTLKQIQREQLRAQAAMEREKERLRAAATRHTETEARKRSEFEAKAQERAQKAAVAAQRAIERTEQQRTRTLEREEQQRTRIAEREEQQRTRAAEREQRARTAAEQREERQRTANARREFSQRQRALSRSAARDEREGRNAGRMFGNAIVGAGSTAGSIGRDLYEQGQDYRQTAAGRETALNSVLIQTMPAGATRDEIAQRRLEIQTFANANNMRVDDIIPALREAQSRHNALGGRTRQERGQALQSTLENIRFASVVDPENVTGLTTFGAMLRQFGASSGMQQELLRNVAGISFSGSVEAEEALRSALPGMLSSLSADLARNPTGDRQAIIRDTITDFMAQIQTVAATGGSVRETSGRVGSLRDSLNRSYTQNRLGNALNTRLERMGHRRNMTDQQREELNRMRTEFGQVFTRGADGNWTMNSDVANSPSRAAEFFGHQFNNDPTALANFLGTRGGGGRAQLLTKPEVRLLKSYFATDEQGRRQYEAVNELRNQTISPAQYQEMVALRNSEQRMQLNRDANNRDAGNQGLQNSWFGRLGNRWSGFLAANPTLATIGSGLGAGLGGLARAGLPALLGNATAGLTMTGIGSNISMLLGMAGRGLGLGAGATVAGYAGVRAGEWIQNYIGGKLGHKPEAEENTLRGMVARRGVTGVAGDAWDNLSYLWNNTDTVGRELGISGGASADDSQFDKFGKTVAEAMVAAAPQMRLSVTISPTDLAHAQGVANTGPNAPPMPR